QRKSLKQNKKVFTKSSAILRKCDILIIGCGIAGATAALELTQKGLDVIVLAAGDSNSAWAQGGIVGSSELLAEDIHAAGASLCNPEAVDQLVRLGPQLIDQLLLKKV